MALEGIGIAASIVGLLAAGAKLVPWLVDVTKKVTDAPDSVKAVMSELRETNIILEQIQIYVLEREPVAESRRSLILLEHISVTLTGFLVTYSDLERHVDFVRSDAGSGMSAFDRAKWILKETEISDATRRLQNHKLSLLTMLNILQCRTLQEASQSMKVLGRYAEHALSQDHHLIAQLERRRGQGSAMMLPAPDAVTMSTSSASISDKPSTITPSVPETIRSRISIPSLSFKLSVKQKKSPLSFEKDLLSSWVYKRLGVNLSTSSLLSLKGSERQIAMSTLSQLSWGQISNLSVFNLPIFETDIYNGHRYVYTVDPVDIPDTSSTLPRPQTSHSGVSSARSLFIAGTSSLAASWGLGVSAPRQTGIATKPLGSMGIPELNSAPIEDARKSKTIDSPRKIFDLHSLSRFTDKNPLIIKKIEHVPLLELGPFAYCVPERPPGIFIGRESILDKIDAHFRPRMSTPTIQQLSGQEPPPLNPSTDVSATPVFVLWGGIGSGKTRIALEYAHKVKSGLSAHLSQPGFQSGTETPSTGWPSQDTYIVWVDKTAEKSVSTAYFGFGRSLVFQRQQQLCSPKETIYNLGYSEQELQAIAVNSLNQSDVPWLMIFDDLDYNDFLLVRYIWPQNPKGSILITTRDPEFYETVDWTIDSTGNIRGSPSQRSNLLRGVWGGAEVADLEVTSAMELLKSELNLTLGNGLGGSGLWMPDLSRLESGIESPRFIQAIGASPALIHAAVEGISMGLVDIDLVLQQGYVNLQAFEKAYVRYEDGSLDSGAPESKYVRFAAQLTAEINKCRSFEITTQHPFLRPGNSWITDQSLLYLITILNPNFLQDQVLLKAVNYRYDMKLTQQHRNERLLAALSWFRRMLGSFPRQHSKFYQFSGTLRQYIASKMDSEDQYTCFDIASTTLADILAVDHCHIVDDELSDFGAVNALLQSQAIVPFEETFPYVEALRQTFSSFGPEIGVDTGAWVPPVDPSYSRFAILDIRDSTQLRFGFPVSFLTALRKYICIINTQQLQSDTIQKSEALNCLDAVKPVLSLSMTETRIYGEKATISFELAAFHTIYAGEAANNGNWEVAIHHYREARKFRTRIGETRSYNRRSTKMSAGAFSLASDDNVIILWPLERLAICNIKIARCLYASGQRETAESEVRKEIISTWFEDLKPFPEGQKEVWHGIEPWVNYELYRCGYACLTLGQMQIQQGRFPAAVHSLKAAISYFLKWSRKGVRMKYIELYPATSYALLGWAYQKIGRYDFARAYLEEAHSNYSSLLQIYILLELEIRKRLCRLEYMLYMSYHEMGDSQKGSYWLTCAGFSALGLNQSIDLELELLEKAEADLYTNLTDFGVSNLFSPEERMMDWKLI